ncbi:MAG: DUF1735 and LamG domain-containing protein [Clostridium sp.]|nr:DUF1735 and LamG domain-containing protein [Bacteroides sp.]MCM1199429.1 DUF1735 and LamG domain-containing protein [Clostridium sp.]
MNRLKNYITGCLATAIILTGCNDALNPVLENAFYINEAASGNSAKRILNEVNGCDVTATVRCGKVLDKDVQVTLSLSQEALDEYNSHNGTTLQMLPSGTHDFNGSTLTIPAGQSIASPLSVHVQPYSTEMIESGVKYALPIAITEVSDGTPTLNVKKAMIYTFEQVIVTNGFQINAQSAAEKVLKDKLAVNEYTLELRVAPKGQGKENEAFMQIYPDTNPINEGYGQIYCRFQTDNSINIKVLSAEGYTARGPFSTQWYHVALVCQSDGTLITYINGSEVQRESRPLWTSTNHLEKIIFGSSSTQYHTYPYCYSEVRLWSKARSASQIADNMYAVDPASEGLEVYYKCNEGQGTILHDATGHGNDIDLETDIKTSLAGNAWQWITPVRSDSDKLPE